MGKRLSFCFFFSPAVNSSSIFSLSLSSPIPSPLSAPRRTEVNITQTTPSSPALSRRREKASTSRMETTFAAADDDEFCDAAAGARAVATRGRLRGGMAAEGRAVCCCCP